MVNRENFSSWLHYTIVVSLYFIIVSSDVNDVWTVSYIMILTSWAIHMKRLWLGWALAWVSQVESRINVALVCALNQPPSTSMGDMWFIIYDLMIFSFRSPTHRAWPPGKRYILIRNLHKWLQKDYRKLPSLNHYASHRRNRWFQSNISPPFSFF